MGHALIDFGEKLHVITRRGYDGDLCRHFVGTLRASTGTLIRIQGYAFVFDAAVGEYRRRPELRTRVFGLEDARLVINIIHPETVLEDIAYVLRDGRLVATDGARFSLDLDEFGVSGQDCSVRRSHGPPAVLPNGPKPQASLPFAGSASASSSNA